MEADTRSAFLDKSEGQPAFKNKRSLCEYCNKWFADKYLYSHIRLHTGDERYVCNVCNKKFNQSYNLRTHVRIHHKERKPFQCPVCGRHFMDKNHFNEHVVAHTGTLPYFCSICDKRYAYKNSLKCHLRYRHKTTLGATKYYDPTNLPNKVIHEEVEENNFFCEICNEGFVYENLLKYHMRIHNPEVKAFLCVLCKRVFSRSTRFHSHLWSKHNIKIAFQCKICKKRFPDRKKLKIHYDCHYAENYLDPSSPEIKDELTDTQEREKKGTELNNNIKNNNKVKKGSHSKITNAPQREIELEQYFENDISQYEHANTNARQKRIKIKTEPEEDIENHLIKNKYTCDVSNVSQELKMETESEQLGDNEITKNRYFCGICCEEFNSITSIQEHLHTHRPQHNFVCDKCNKSFDSKSLLKQHACFGNFVMEPLQCMICKEMFSIWKNFKEHLSKHANEDTSL